jgi:rhodanese-related sulfurtransferase
MKTLSAQELKSLMDGSSPVLIDVREPWEFETCRIAGAKHMPMATIPARINELDKNAATVVICHHGMRSLQVAHYLVQSGFADVYNLEGGIDAWASEVDPDVSRY